MKNTPEIITISEKHLVGLNIQTSLSENRTRELWQAFGPIQKEIKNRIGSETYSVEIYKTDLEMRDFTPQTKFEKWAAIAVTGFDEVPQGLNTLTIPAGKYARFIYKGPHKDFPSFAQYIFMQWLPSSEFTLDDRPHFEVMGENYFGPSNPDSEEEIWIPITTSTQR